MTLDELWHAQPRITTSVAVRAGHATLYLSMAHETWEEAAAAARQDQEIATDDLMATDWQAAAAPPGA